jgi:hypothetical protein
MGRRQNHQPLPRNQVQDARRVPILVGEQEDTDEEEDEDGGELDPQQAAWIRNFVRMALNDEEDDADED